MAFVPLGQVHRRVRAAGRRSGDLYERVPAPLVLSGQQARVGAAAAGEGEVGRGHDRPVLRRPGQANGDSLGPLLVLHRAGLSASTPARGSRDRGVLRRQYRAQDTRKRRRRAHRGQGELLARSLGEAGVRGRGLLRSRVRATAPVQPRSTIDGDRGEGISGRKTRRRNRTRWRDTRSQRHSGPCQADTARDVRIRVRDRRQRRTHRAPEQRCFHESVLGSSPGDQGARLVAERIDGRPQLPRRKGAEHLGDRRAGRLEGVRRAARERGVRGGPRKDLADGAAACGVSRRRGRPERVARAPARPPDEAIRPAAARIGAGASTSGSTSRAGRARGAGGGVQPHGGAAPGVVCEPRAQGRGANAES